MSCCVTPFGENRGIAGVVSLIVIVVLQEGTHTHVCVCVLSGKKYKLMGWQFRCTQSEHACNDIRGHETFQLNFNFLRAQVKNNPSGDFFHVRVPCQGLTKLK